MKTITIKTGLNVKAGLKAGGLQGLNHNRTGLRVRAAVKAGGLTGSNHNRALLSL